GRLQVPVPLVALGQPGQALTAALEGLDVLLAVAAHAQGDPRVSQITIGGVVILVVQLDALPVAAPVPVQQRMVAQGCQGGATGAQFDLGFSVHRKVSQECGIVRAGRAGGALIGQLFQISVRSWPEPRDGSYNSATFKWGPPMPTNLFVSLFGRSPIGPMQQHMAKAHECAAQLVPFFQAVIAEDWERVEQLQKDMARMENEADKLKKDVRQHLPKSLFLPVPRSDLLDLLSVQDKIPNRAKDIAGLMLGRQMRIPQPLQAPMLAYVSRCVEASAQALKALKELDSLLETGFGGREVALVEKMVEELEEIERDTDRMQISIRRELYALEKELPPVDVMFMYKIIEWIGDVADRAERVGNRLEQLLAR